MPVICMKPVNGARGREAQAAMDRGPVGAGGGGGLGVPFRGRPVGAGGGLGVPFRRGRPGAAVGAAGAAAGYAAARSVISFSRCTIKASMSSFFVRQQKGK